MPTINEIKELEQWLKELKAGDEAVVCHNYDMPNLVKVIRTTASQVIVGKDGGHETRFRRSDGYEVGTSTDWHRRYIAPASPENREEAARGQCISKLHAFQWPTLSTERLQRIIAITEEVNADAI